MKYFFLIWKNIKRNKRRTILTVLSVAVALFLFTLIRTVISAMDATVRSLTKTPVLVVEDRSMPFSSNLPEAYRAKIDAVEGVQAVMATNFVGGTVKGEQGEVRFAALDVSVARKVWADIFDQIPGETWQAFEKERMAAIVGQGNMEKYGWKVGDMIILRFGSLDIQLKIVGVSPPGLFGDAGYLHRDYFRELFPERPNVSMYYVSVKDYSSMVPICSQIDQLFVNSSTPTRTEPMAKFLARFVDSLGGIQQLVSGFVLAILITIVAVAANTMAMAIRERQTEVAVLRTLGFRSSQILVFMLSESTLLSLVGGVLGCGMSYLLLSGISLPIGGVGAFFVVTGKTIAETLLIASIIGLISGFIPGLFATRRSIVDALRKVG